MRLSIEQEDIMMMEVYNSIPKDNDDNYITVSKNGLVMSKYVVRPQLHNCIIEDLIDDDELLNTGRYWIVLFRPVENLPDRFMLWLGEGRCALAEPRYGGTVGGATCVANTTLSWPPFSNTAHLPSSSSPAYRDYIEQADSEYQQALLEHDESTAKALLLRNCQAMIDSCWIDADKEIQQQRGKRRPGDTDVLAYYDAYTIVGQTRIQTVINSKGQSKRLMLIAMVED